jgi:hypothetical protein
MRKYMYAGGGLVLAGALVWFGFTYNSMTQYGSPVNVGNGEARTFVTRGLFGRVVEVGVRFDESTIDGLPSQEAETVLQFPSSIKATPITHFALDWNPHGHEPRGIYSVPHFDYHFYLISEWERAAIEAGVCTTKEDILVPNPPGVVTVTCEVFERTIRPLPADEIASGYSMIPATIVPNMGVHLVNLTSSEFKGQPFTYTWIYGAFDGNLSFLEPMIAKAFLEKHANVRVPIATPAAMPEAGWYPTAYSIRHDDKLDAYFVTLESFKRFDASKASIKKTAAAVRDPSAYLDL